MGPVANEDFHLIVGIDLDDVVSAPIIRPTRIQLTSFNGRGQIGGGCNKAQAMALEHVDCRPDTDGLRLKASHLSGVRSGSQRKAVTHEA